MYNIYLFIDQSLHNSFDDIYFAKISLYKFQSGL